MSITNQDTFGEVVCEISTQTGPWAVIPTWVFPYLEPLEFKVYAALRSQQAPFIVRHEYLAQKVRLSTEEVAQALEKIESLGLLTKNMAARSDGSTAFVGYHLVDIDPQSRNI
jgi:predicted transcriptional regulator